MPCAIIAVVLAIAIPSRLGARSAAAERAALAALAEIESAERTWRKGDAAHGPHESSSRVLSGDATRVVPGK